MALKIFEEQNEKDYVFLCQNLIQLARFYSSADSKQALAFLERAQALTARFEGNLGDSYLRDILQTKAQIYKAKS